MIKILQVVPCLDINAGMMTVIMNYYRRFDRTRVQFDFLYFEESEKSHEEEILSLGGQTFFLGKVSFNNKYRQELKKFFSEHKGEYTAVHCHPIWAAALVGNIAQKSGIKHVISHSHSTEYSDKKISAIRNRLMMPIILKNSTDLVACSNDAVKLFGKKKDVFVLHNAIDVKRYMFNAENRETIRKELSVSDDDLLVCNIGRFSLQKNHAFIIPAFKEILKELPQAKLLLVGDGELREEIQALAKDLLPDDRIILTGKRTDIPELLSAADIFWLPSLFEGAPLSVIEAQASGLFCIMSDTITREVNVGMCEYASLDNMSEWIDAFRKAVKFNEDRVKIGESLLGGSYDIKSETENLFKFYSKLSD